MQVLHDEAVCDYLNLLVPNAHKDNDADARCPSLKLVLPILKSGFRNDDEMRAGDVAVVFEVNKEGDGLESFAETLDA